MLVITVISAVVGWRAHKAQEAHAAAMKKAKSDNKDEEKGKASETKKTKGDKKKTKKGDKPTATEFGESDNPVADDEG